MIACGLLELFFESASRFYTTHDALTPLIHIEPNTSLDRRSTLYAGEAEHKGGLI